MIVPDVNLLVYAHNARAPQHAKARSWWEGCVNGSRPVALAWIVIGGFLRLMTHPRVLAMPMAVGDATARVREWLRQPPVILLHPGDRFSALYLDYLEALGAGGNLVTDAHLAALAVENQAELHSNDSDFARFTGLRWKNPLS
jgi:uncharacterized protein